MTSIIRQPLFFLAIWLISSTAHAFNPVLNFSDLISGPDTGLGDGLGSGVIVTIWGQNLGSSQSGSTITFTDSSGSSHGPAHIYYWKNADGALPGGPANLYVSHYMQEIAFSIPDAAQGPGSIKVTVDGVDSNSLPFTIRPGGIYHVKSSGDDSNNGSFNSPWLTANHGIGNDGPIAKGDTVYVHTLTEGVAGTTTTTIRPGGQDIDDTSRDAGLSDQMALVTYPGSTFDLIGAQPIRVYWGSGMVFSKIKATVADTPTRAKVGGLTTTNWGRIVGNLVQGHPSYPITDGTSGAFPTGRPIERNPGIEGAIVFGNEVRDYGDEFETSKLHHATYFKIREAGPDIEPFEVGWNYLHNNRARYGLHFYDQDDPAGIDGTVKIHNNVVVDQGGAGIHLNMPSEFTNTWDVYNNIVINAGLESDNQSGQSHTRASADLANSRGTINFYNNTLHTWDAEVQTSLDDGAAIEVENDGITVVNINDNVIYTDEDRPFIDLRDDADPSGSGNAWIYSAGGSPTYAITPSFDTNPITDETGLIISINGPRPILVEPAAILGQSDSPLARDIYGIGRVPGGSDTGAIQYLVRPNPPANISLD